MAQQDNNGVPEATSTEESNIVVDNLWDACAMDYPRLVKYMNANPKTMMLRWFGSLSARNLLYLQSELVFLEACLRYVEKGDQASQIGKRNMYAVYAYWLNSSNSRTSEGLLRDGRTKQTDFVLDIRETLKEYSSPKSALTFFRSDEGQILQSSNKPQSCR